MTKTKAINKKNKSQEKERQYPIPRGFVGYSAYYLGMAATRLFIRLRYKNLDLIPTEIPYVIAANHQTYVDGMWIGSALKKAHFRHMACIAGKDLEDDHGILGKIIVRVGRAIAIDRMGSPIRGLIIAKKKVDEGNILLVHPEGTRSHDGKLAELKNGAAYIAIKSKVPMVPVYIEGGYSVFPRQQKWPQPRDPVSKHRKTVTLHFGPLLLPQDFEGPQEMTDALTEWMLAKERECLAALPSTHK